MDTRTAQAGPTRRTVLATTAFAVPAIAMTATSPAFASTGAQTLTVSTPNMQAPAAGNTPVTITVTDNNGQPAPSGAVSLIGPSGVSFSPATPTISNGTAASTMTTTDNWATPGSTLTITAATSGGNTSAGLTVLGANALAGGPNGIGTGSGTPTGNGGAGTGSTSRAISPPEQLLMSFPSPIVSLAQGSGSGVSAFTLALLQDGTVWGVGTNSYGQLGDGTTTSRTTWAKVPGLTGVVEICAGGQTAMARLSNGGIRSWGLNNFGQLGNGTTASSSTPVTVQNITNATQIVAGAANGWALLSTGEVRSWGYGAYGGNGNGGNKSQSLPVAVPGINTAIRISCADYTPYVL